MFLYLTNFKHLIFNEHVIYVLVMYYKHFHGTQLFRVITSCAKTHTYKSAYKICNKICLLQ